MSKGVHNWKFLGKVLFLEDEVDGAKDVWDDERRLLQSLVDRKEVAREVVEHHLERDQALGSLVVL